MSPINQLRKTTHLIHVLGTLFLHVSKKKYTNKSAEKGNGKGKGKEKEKICVDDNAFVEDVSDFQIDLRFMRGGRPENYDAYDPGTDSNGSNSWYSHCDVNTFFKIKYDLLLNRNLISKALSHTRNVVYGDEKAQYALLRDYGKTLLKINPGSTIQICTSP
ncbi:hypothetical protein Ahy_B10g103740 isoform B [Arachis hypogaea]|uniref:Uncharacterized protein n=1 Tax=Arachis hypogaea TaxID=3818 RepID=A0A444X461_ARAHY|nr:hypothetical protein Ahy_B10g103740 isoform B [Arachis hypogaea]